MDEIEKQQACTIVEIFQWLNSNVPHDEKRKIYQLFVEMCFGYFEILTRTAIRDTSAFLDMFADEDGMRISINGALLSELADDVIKKRNWEECFVFRNFSPEVRKSFKIDQ